ncbi:type II toxin-antitoxin system CcdA family antitoxin [Pseudomonas sp. GM55]|uniref:type II toxin-antitoxin system CcdA family antitoxin n=1 Tax=Pseudomonas sp. GM55 TaxID=1144333 RepID=UPI000270AF9F|nr:type II toxin-antitoxin system CcdA family antitoxin [Pseudomonas sp. GM55]EJM65942.1 Post-segregation antitoxin CcdA [Pseudomonas sp. GM55]
MQSEEEIQFELALAEALRRKQCEQWLAENSKAVNAYNEEVEAHGFLATTYGASDAYLSLRGCFSACNNGPQMNIGGFISHLETRAESAG